MVTVAWNRHAWLLVGLWVAVSHVDAWGANDRPLAVVVPVAAGMEDRAAQVGLELMQAPDDEAARQAALSLGLGVSRIGGCLVLLRPVAVVAYDYSAESGPPLPELGSSRRLWTFLRGDSFAVISAEWLQAVGGRVGRCLTDGMAIGSENANPSVVEATSRWAAQVIPGGFGEGQWTIRGHSWFAHEVRDSHLQHQLAARSYSVGDLPLVASGTSIPPGAYAVSEALEQIGAALPLKVPLVAHPDLASEELWIASDGARADELLAAVAHSLGAEWRLLGDMGYLAPHHAAYGQSVSWHLRRAPGRPGDRAIIQLPLRTDALNTSWVPIGGALEVVWELSDGRTGRVLLQSADPAQISVWAVPGPDFGPPDSHCASAALVALRHALGRASGAATELAFSDLAEGAEVSGNELVAMGARFGLPLQAVRATRSELVGFEGPCIIHIDIGHYVCVESVSDGLLRLWGPTGRRACVLSSAGLVGFSGIVFLPDD